MEKGLYLARQRQVKAQEQTVNTSTLTAVHAKQEYIVQRDIFPIVLYCAALLTQNLEDYGLAMYYQTFSLNHCFSYDTYAIHI